MKTIDTRDLLERLNELESLELNLSDARKESEIDPAVTPDDLEDMGEEVPEDFRTAFEDFGEDEQEELKELRELESSITDFRHGATMIPEVDFTEYAQELAEDIDAVKSDMQWPYSHIDWESAAEELKQDYYEVEYQGVTYLVR